MRITVFTSNQPRHISLIENLASIAEEVFAVQECNTVFPGQVEDFFHRSEVMQDYFSRLIASERIVFGRPRFGPKNVSHLVLKSGDLGRLEIKALQPGLDSDVYVVFGSSFIKGHLCDFLIKHKALNIHMGISPYYRGSSCNFWALYDEKPDYVGATIHMLSKGLDSGSMLFHALPKPQAVDPFLLGMLGVKAAQMGLIQYLQSGKIWHMKAVRQDRSLEIRYTRNRDFTDKVASEYLTRLPSPDSIYASLKARDMSHFLHPFIL